MGTDAPVYIWWARYGGHVGLGAAGLPARPGIVGLLSTLSSLTTVAMPGVVAAAGATFAATAGLAAAALLEIVLEPNRLRSFLTVLLTGAFVVFLALGYLAALAGATLVIAAVAALSVGLVTRRWRSMVVGAVLLGAAGLVHPVVLAFGAVLVFGGAVAVRLSGERRPILRLAFADPSTRLLVALVAGVAIAGVLLAVSGTLTSAPFDTSRDSVLRRFGMTGALAADYRGVLLATFPWFLFAFTTAAILVGWVVGPRKRSRPRAGFLGGVLAIWVVVTLCAIPLLLVGFAVPAQRLTMVCVPLAVVTAWGLSEIMRSDFRDLPRATGRARLLRYLNSPLLPRSLAVVAFLVMFALPFRGFLRPAPFQTAPALSQAALVADALSAEPSQTPLVLVADNASAGIVTAYANALRDQVAPTSAPDVYVFMGGPQDLEAGEPRITGSPEHDRLALETWQSIRPLLEGSPLIVALQSFDPRAYRATLALPGRQVIGDGVVALPGYGPTGQIGSSQPYLVGPWLPIFLAPALLMILGILGWPWTGLLLASDVRSTRLALAPSLGLGGIVVSSVVVDLAGIRLASGGALAAIGVTAVGGLVAYAFFARRFT